MALPVVGDVEVCLALTAAGRARSHQGMTELLNDQQTVVPNILKHPEVLSVIPPDLCSIPSTPTGPAAYNRAVQR